MIVSCQACSTKFQVPDEKVAGKRARLPCRKCGQPIPIDGRGLRSPATKATAPPRLPPRPSPFPDEAREDWKVRFTDQTVTLARAEALALSMQARDDRQSHPEFSEADANMTTPESAANSAELDRAHGIRDFDDGEASTGFQSAPAESPSFRPKTSRPPPPPRRAPDDLSFREITSAPPPPRLPPPPPLPGSRAASSPTPLSAPAPRAFEPPPIPKPEPLHNSQTFPSFGRIHPTTSPFAQGSYHSPRSTGSSFPPPSASGPISSRPGAYYPGVLPSTFPPPADAAHDPNAYLGGGALHPPSNPQFPPSSAPPAFGGFAPVPPGLMTGPGAAAYAFGPAGPFVERSARYSMSDLTGASRIQDGPPDAASWRRKQKIRSTLLATIMALAAVSLGLCAIYLVLPDVFYRGVDALRDQAIALHLLEKRPDPRPAPGLPFATAQAGQALDRAATLAQSCTRPEGPRGPGRVEVRFHRTGAVQSVELFSPFRGTEVGRCVQKAFYEVTVPSYGGTEVIVAKPFTVP